MGYETVVVALVASIIGGTVVNWIKGKQEDASEQLKLLVSSVDRMTAELAEIKSDLRSLSEMAESRFEHLEDGAHDRENRLRQIEKKVRV